MPVNTGLGWLTERPLSDPETRPERFGFGMIRQSNALLLRHGHVSVDGMSTPNHGVDVERFTRDCIKNDREVLSPREAGRLFNVDPSTVRSAVKDGHIRPVIELTVGRNVPLYRLRDLAAHFSARTVDPELLSTMRKHGTTMFLAFGSPGGWLILSERPGLGTWGEAAA